MLYLYIYYVKTVGELNISWQDAVNRECLIVKILSCEVVVTRTTSPVVFTRAENACTLIISFPGCIIAAAGVGHLSKVVPCTLYMASVLAVEMNLQQKKKI
jgi:hypothetical protein